MEPSSTLNLQSLISKLPERFRAKVLNVYLFGSRVWRDNPSKREEDLDWDFFMVIDGYSEGEHDIKLEDPLYRDRVDISAFSCEKWNALIRSHQIVYLMCPYLPQVRFHIQWCKWKEDYQVPGFQIKLRKLVSGVMMERHICWNKARLFFSSNNYYFGKKNLVHGIRYLRFGCQLALGASELQPQCSRDIYDQVFAVASQDWSEHEKSFGPIFESETTKFKSLASEKVHSAYYDALERIPSGTSVSQLDNYMSLYGHSDAVKRLVRFFGCDSATSAEFLRVSLPCDPILPGNLPLLEACYCSFFSLSSYESLTWLTSLSTAISLVIVPQGTIFCLIHVSGRWRALPCSGPFEQEETFFSCIDFHLDALDPSFSYQVVLRDRKPEFLYAIERNSRNYARLSFRLPFNSAASQEVLPSTPPKCIIDTAQRISSRDTRNDIYSVFVLCGEQEIVEFPSTTRLAIEDIASEPKLEVSNLRLLALIRSIWPADCASLVQPRLHEQLHQLFTQYSALVVYVQQAMDQLKEYLYDDKLFSMRLFEFGHRRASNVLFSIRESFQTHAREKSILDIVPDELALIPLNHLIDTMAKFSSTAT